MVYLHHNRLTPGNIDLQPERYAFLRGMAEERLEAMESYLTDDEECRSTSDCGTCDVCRSRAGEERTRAAILNFLRTHPGAGISEVKQFCGNPGNGMPQNAIEVYRRLVDEGLAG